MDDAKSTNMIDILLTVSNDTVDINQMKNDDDELHKISQEFPNDGVVDISQMERLAGLSMRGIAICDYWAPIIIVIMGEVNANRNKARNLAYINATDSNGGKLTAEMRKCISESDSDYVRLCVIYDRMKAILRHFEDKRDSFKTFHFFMKDQQKAYGYQSGRHINGEELEYKKQIAISKSSYNGEEDF
jgi:hypothetical protein